MAAERGDNVWFEDPVVSCNRRVLGGSILRNAWFVFYTDELLVTIQIPLRLTSYDTMGTNFCVKVV